MTASVGIDVGGTFTDLVSIDADGAVEARKVLSTPADQSEGVESSLRSLDRRDLSRVVHGTTVATNMLLERAGARVVLCATAGFTDLLELRRQVRASLYDLTRHHPEPLVDPAHVVAVDERIAPEGVIRPLLAPAVTEAVDRVQALEPDIVAVALLHAYRDPSHERALAAAIRERMPHTDVVCSSDVFPEIREYERTTTTVAEAYLRPGVARYVRRLADRLRAMSLPALGVMTSSGGMRTARDAWSSAAQLALSGPAGGVVGAAAVLRAAGLSRALTIDIGGTSADVGLILDGEPLVEPGGAVAGVPIALPRVLVETVSAGGGSIAWIDDGGALRVGPRSAGSVPGPIAFGRGGTQPTVTDAHVMLDNIRAERMSGGVRLDVNGARAGVEALARQLGRSAEDTARAIVATADATMARALRRVSVERGVDPRQCALVAFGGGGPLHACGLADIVGAARVLVPPHAGVLSALGLAMTAERREGMANVMQRAGETTVEALAAAMRDAEARCEGAPGWTRRWFLRARFVGQGHELDVTAAPGDAPAAIRDRFSDLHRARVGFDLPVDVEIVSARCVVSDAPRAVRLERGAENGWDDALRTDSGGRCEVTLAGPCSVILPDATMLVSPGWTATSLAMGGWMLERAR
ncbi:MAG TPA: hydantoinase/oxoprolinase family protein [Gemmatimonadaceae bacterium]|nr:hydantoinase/oxoprolinase family protein [Gemmatimonadaceae bacterium]